MNHGPNVSMDVFDRTKCLVRDKVCILELKIKEVTGDADNHDSHY